MKKRGAKRTTVLEKDEKEFRRRVDELRQLNTNWTKIATELNVKYEYLREWHKREDYHDPRITEVTDVELDTFVKDIVVDHPRRGQRDIRSRLEARNVHVSRKRLLESIQRVDPAGVEAR